MGQTIILFVVMIKISFISFPAFSKSCNLLANFVGSIKGKFIEQIACISGGIVRAKELIEKKVHLLQLRVSASTYQNDIICRTE